MNTSLEAQWETQAERRRRIIKLMLLVCCGFLSLGVMVWIWVTQPLFGQPQLSQKSAVDPARLQSHVEMLSLQLSPRDESHPGNLDRAAAYIRTEFEKAGARVSEQPYQVNDKIYRNVIGKFGAETSERVVIGAHYDTAGPFPGADDNASGIAGLIELAHLLGKQNLPVTVELVAFTLEEPPYFHTAQMGSAVHAAALRQAGVKVRVMLSLEMIGYFSDVPGSQAFPATFLSVFYPSRGDFIGVVGRFQDGLKVRRVKKAMLSGSALPVYSISAPTFVPGVDFSDHLNYWQAGYTAVMITDTAFYRNRNYHSAQDTPEKLDYQRMAMVIEGVYAAVLSQAR